MGIGDCLVSSYAPPPEERLLVSSKAVRRIPPSGRARVLGSSLDRMYRDYNREDSATDPVHLVRPFTDPADREVAGFCAAALAFGRVGSVINSIRTLFASRSIGPPPSSFPKTI